jgi:hypothetical protein
MEGLFWEVVNDAGNVVRRRRFFMEERLGANVSDDQ